MKSESRQCAVTVVLCTFNRAATLAAAIDRLLKQRPASPAYELIVVDNNSTDDTRAVVAQHQAVAGVPVRYVFEPQQGLSQARNAGIAAARADIVAFTDDDVRAGDDWVKVIEETFDAHPGIDALGGRTLPLWPSDPPRWLTRLHWVGPLALQDYGDQPLVMDAGNALCLAGANLAFRRHVFASIGGFNRRYPRSQDTELMHRLWRSGRRAMYVPQMTVHAAVQRERLTKGYHRQWHSRVGRTNAQMASDALVAGRSDLPAESRDVARLLGIPRFAVRQLLGESCRWFSALIRRHDSQAFWHELRMRQILGYIRESRTLFAHRRPDDDVTASLTIPQGPTAAQGKHGG
jgi:glucosyl-dolichyl phosphate glucuronosyltransferase